VRHEWPAPPSLHIAQPTRPRACGHLHSCAVRLVQSLLQAQHEPGAPSTGERMAYLVLVPQPAGGEAGAGRSGGGAGPLAQPSAQALAQRQLEHLRVLLAAVAAQSKAQVTTPRSRANYLHDSCYPGFKVWESVGGGSMPCGSGGRGGGRVSKRARREGAGMSSSQVCRPLPATLNIRRSTYCDTRAAPPATAPAHPQQPAPLLPRAATSSASPPPRTAAQWCGSMLYLC
jgi:hypothetical protein